MLDQYITVKGYGEQEIIINKSRFISYVNRAETEDEAIQFIEEIKKKHWDATHNCSAYIAGEHDQHQKANDDGEPSGTAGKPILEVIKKTGLKDTVVVVTRYFGGIKLGAGGLIRAYGQGASEGIQAAGIIQRTLHTKMHIAIDYSLLGKVENELRSADYPIHHTDFLEQVTITTLSPKGEEEKLEQWITDITSAQANITRGDAIYVDVPYKR